jgi:small subunit ribosomal protein S8
MDTIANMVAHIVTANHKFKESIDVPSSKLKVEIARVLKEEGYISNYRVAPDKKQGILRLTLKYTAAKERVIRGMKRISKPGLRAYRPYNDIPSVQNGLGTVIVSTSRGVMSAQSAKEKKVGGEVLCYVW